MTPKEEQNYKWDIETSWSQGFNQGKKETIAKLKEVINKLETFVYLKEFSDWQKISHEGLDKKEVLEILEDIK